MWQTEQKHGSSRNAGISPGLGRALPVDLLPVLYYRSVLLLVQLFSRRLYSAAAWFLSFVSRWVAPVVVTPPLTAASVRPDTHTHTHANTASTSAVLCGQTKQSVTALAIGDTCSTLTMHCVLGP